jgi:hypothetical protein
MTSDITEEEWQRIRAHYGDLAFEHPEMHRMMLNLIDAKEIDGALEKATKELRADCAEGPSARLGLSEQYRGDSMSVEDMIARAKSILDRAPASRPIPATS